MISMRKIQIIQPHQLLEIWTRMHHIDESFKVKAYNIVKVIISYDSVTVIRPHACSVACNLYINVDIYKLCAVKNVMHIIHKSNFLFQIFS